uniref:hypothetical protein n=1 Tax=Acetatifactor sp. TaxID=1872090 RepID=UPI00405675DD
MDIGDILRSIASVVGVILVILIVFGRIFLPLFLRLYVKRAEKKGDICDKCKGKMVTTHTSLYLIPVTFDQEHDQSAEYYIRNARLIQSEEQIPAGNRACRMQVLLCENCGCREVVVTDFLRVREQELLKGAEVFPYEQFAEFFLQQELL